MKNTPPTTTAIAAMVRTTLWSSLVNGVTGAGVVVVSRAISASRVPTRRRDDCLGISLHHERPGVHLVADIDRARLALAGEQRGVDAKAVRRRSGVGRYPVPGLSEQDIADDDLAGVDLDPFVVAPDDDRSGRSERSRAAA